MRWRIKYPGDKAAEIDVEADDLDDLELLANEALKILWGKKNLETVSLSYE